jgi:hypothetical protein
MWKRSRTVIDRELCSYSTCFAPISKALFLATYLFSFMSSATDARYHLPAAPLRSNTEGRLNINMCHCLHRSPPECQTPASTDITHLCVLLIPARYLRPITSHGSSVHITSVRRTPTLRGYRMIRKVCAQEENSTIGYILIESVRRPLVDL